MPTHEGIDRFFDRVDGVVDVVDRVINRSGRTEDKLKGLKRDSSAAAKKSLARGPVFRIEEIFDASTGTPIFVVTDGSTRAECATRAAAETVRDAMEKAAP